ncbi:MAG: hypothetical protein J5637_04650 [Prevotella sp.]|nr:hypothetical protein [Prevotella sp.]
MKEKCVYNRPFMRVEKFSPNVYVAGCWCVESGYCYSYLIHDKGGMFGLGNPDEYYNPQGDDEVLAQNHGTYHPLPGNSSFPWFKDEEKPRPTNINDGHYYDYPRNYNYDTRTHYNSRITTDIFVVSVNNQTHYVKKITDGGNHS